MKKNIIWISAPFILSACISTQYSEKSPDWFKLGERAANRGDLLVNQHEFKNINQLGDNASAMFLRYQQGYKAGLITFCKVENAFQFGIKGGNYQGQCEAFSNEPQFKYEWSKAYQQFMFPEGPK